MASNKFGFSYMDRMKTHVLQSSSSFFYDLLFGPNPAMFIPKDVICTMMDVIICSLNFHIPGSLYVKAFFLGLKII
jgi:hypothetical protein